MNAQQVAVTQAQSFAGAYIRVTTMRDALVKAIENTKAEIEEWNEEQEEHNYELTATEDFEYCANLEGTISGYEHALNLIDELFSGVVIA